MTQISRTLCLAVWITGVILSIDVEVSLGDIAVDCCLKVSHRPIPKRIITCYHEQVRGDGCNINAVVFLTRKGRRLCSPPEAEWVQKLMFEVDNSPKHFKKKHCQDKMAKFI